jgi:hypothetical protein
MELFPLEPRELFEIYFVRLIGTPNQQFNIYDMPSNIGIVSSS